MVLLGIDLVHPFVLICSVFACDLVRVLAACALR